MYMYACVYREGMDIADNVIYRFASINSKIIDRTLNHPFNNKYMYEHIGDTGEERGNTPPESFERGNILSPTSGTYMYIA